MEEEAAESGPRRRKNIEEYRLELEERRLAVTERMVTLMETYEQRAKNKKMIMKMC